MVCFTHSRMPRVVASVRASRYGERKTTRKWWIGSLPVVIPTGASPAEIRYGWQSVGRVGILPVAAGRLELERFAKPRCRTGSVDRELTTIDLRAWSSCAVSGFEKICADASLR